MFSEIGNHSCDIKEADKRRSGMDLSGNRVSQEFREADRQIAKRIDGQEQMRVFNPGESFRPMEYIYSRIWERTENKSELFGNLKECNPNYKLGGEWRVNCQRCVPTYEMRRRGYDVTAQPKPRDAGIFDLSINPFAVWQNPDVIHCRGSGQEDIENHMRQWGDGARAQVVVVWKGTNSGHSFVAEQVDGKTIYIDPQTGSTDVSDYFGRVQMGSVQMCRMDQLDVTNRILECSRKVG